MLEMLAIAQQFFLDSMTEGIPILFVVGYGLYFWINYISVDKQAETSDNSLVQTLVVRKYRK